MAKALLKIMEMHTLRRCAAVVLLLCLALTPLAIADTISGRVIGITDGDTLTVLDSRFQQHKIRLTGIDAPESDQPFGTVSRQHLATLVFGKQVTVESYDVDRYGRTLGAVPVAPEAGKPSTELACQYLTLDTQH